MTNDLLGERRVVEYLQELEAVLALLPPEEAGLLREQIDAHLREALGDAPGDEEVEEVLRRLGPPSQLLPAPGRRPGPREWVRTRASQLRGVPRAWLAALVAAVLVLVGVGGYGIALLTAPSLQYDVGASGWWYPADSRDATTASAGNVTQSNTIMRFGHEQGFVFQIINPSSWSQTVLGPTPGEVSIGVSPLQVAVAVPAPNDLGRMFELHYGDGVTIPPHHVALLRLLWRTNDCFPAGSGAAMSSVAVRVRVGGLTRTEEISFGNNAWGLIAPADAPNPERCPS